MAVRFNLIGPFEIVTADGTTHRPSTPKVCQTLALLLTRPGEVVTTDTLVRELWGQRPPRSALTTLPTYVHHARRLLAAAEPAASALLATRSPGYVIQAAADDIDTAVFERLVDHGRQDLRTGHPHRATRHLQQALALRRGPALSNIPTGDILTGRAARLEELHLRALELRIEAEARLGRQRESIPELRLLVHDYPLNEWFHGQLISALRHAGRRAEALQAYGALERLLHAELGLDPSPEIRRIRDELLADRPLTPAHGA
ncbi:AfsR/SARP family transcriptional regulator [Streptomyces sp. B1866]|uniref:AfsR/SARP family transcriptional regulator n=1 Tax=Streptomyces sp. B1866 TaxID=3075431 RepID=UPI00288EC49D|nr:AfsR/SARP family transcriptional regulator [Streptomyces sp. B1866]MDT3399934.1 AfsR/SARP family transcriptional regulator [Streptomyces sp. B1866]